MGIKAGSGKGGGDASGKKDREGRSPIGIGVGGGDRKRKTPIPAGPADPKKPLKPIEQSPFPDKREFRLGHYRILEERDDYLLCTGYDPNAKWPFSEVTPSAFKTGVLMKVAKPPELQRTSFDGQTVTVGGVDYTYTYSDDEFGVRKAQWTNGSGTQREVQRIDLPYRVGDLLIAVEIRKNSAVDGMEVADEAGARLTWIDLNASGRHWKSDDVRYAKLTASLSAASSFLTGETTAAAVFVEEDPNSAGNLIATTDTLVVTNRWVDLSLSSGKYVVVQRIQGEWVIIASECP